MVRGVPTRPPHRKMPDRFMSPPSRQPPTSPHPARSLRWPGAGSVPGLEAALAALGIVFATTVVQGCGEAPALQVGDVAYGAGHLVGLSEERIQDLVRVTAVGLAHLRDEPGVPGRPILDRRRTEAEVAVLRREVVLEAAGAGDAVLRARYRPNPYPELVVRHLLIRADRGESRATREDARRRAEEALARARDGEPFPELAAELSDEPGADRRGGLLEPGREGTWVREFWEAALPLEEGEVSAVVETVYGYHVLRLEERRAVPFEEAWPRVAEEVARMVDDGEAWSARLEEWTRGLDVRPRAVADFDPDAPDPGAVVAVWPGRELDASGLAHHLRGLRQARVRSFLEGPPSIREEEAERAARNRILREEAEARGIHLSAEVRDRMEAEWGQTLSRWAAALGLTEAPGPTELREAALAALGATGQDARIARQEMREWGAALGSAYPVIRP